MDYESFMNKMARVRTPSVLRSLFDGFHIDSSFIKMTGGLPSPELFPLKSAKLQLRDGSEIDVSEDDMVTALQYGNTAGNRQLLQWVTDLTKLLHNPPTMQNPDHPGALEIMMTNGAQDGLSKCLECLAEEGDVIMIEEPVYSSFLTMVIPYGCQLVSVKTDHYGIIPEDLERKLAELKKSKGPKTTGMVKALYLVPNGGNPTGSRYTLSRKQAIYRLAQEYNFFIIEDDPYYFIEEKPLPPTFLSMDVDGRVLRVDSFSKTISPGLRIGYLSGPRPIIRKALVVGMSSTLGCSGIAQVILLQLLKQWGHSGYMQHCESVARFYDQKRAICTELAEKHLKGIAKWHTPTGGMFLWIEFTGLKDSYPFVMEQLVKRKLLIVCGSAFIKNVKEPCPYVRISFSLATREEMDKAFAIIAEELQKTQEVKNGT